MARYVFCKPDKPKLTYWTIIAFIVLGIIATAFLGLTA